MNQFCVLVASSDSRKDIFDICFANADRIWKDCDWPRYVGFNGPVVPQPDFRVLIAPATDDWCLQVKRYVDLLPPDIRYILLMVEDVLFMQPVNAKLLDELAFEMSSTALVYLRLVPLRRNWLGKIANHIVDFGPGISPFREIERNEPYYSSTEMTIWRRDYLLKQLSGASDAWAFEHLLSSNEHYAVRNPVFDQHQIVQKGRWNWDAPKLVRNAGLIWPHSNRPFQTWRARLRGHLANLSFALFGYASFRFKRWIGIKT